MKCPNCGLINPDSALRCDCGYDFPSATMKESYLTSGTSVEERGPASSAGTSVAAFGGVLLVFAGLTATSAPAVLALTCFGSTPYNTCVFEGFEDRCSLMGAAAKSRRQYGDVVFPFDRSAHFG